MPLTAPLTAALFDLNGVFIQSLKLSERFETDFGVPAATFVPELSRILKIVRLPNAPAAFSLWQPVLAGWKLELTERQFWDYWFGAEVPNDDMIMLAEELRSAEVQVAAISNNFRERTDYYGLYFPWMQGIFSAVHYSWETGLVKPDPRAWENLLATLGVQASEAAYFDDSNENIVVADSLGMHAQRFVDADTTRKLFED